MKGDFRFGTLNGRISDARTGKTIGNLKSEQWIKNGAVEEDNILN